VNTSLAMLVRSRRAGLVLAMTMAVAGLAACGGNESETNYSASSFSECLSAKDVEPTDIATGQSEGDRYFDELNRLAGQAARENGAIEAFGNEALPGASTTYFLFFAAHDTAQAAEGRLRRIAREEQSSDRLDVRGNLLTVASTETEAQTRIISECLDRSRD
jgi:hypothetical protein